MTNGSEEKSDAKAQEEQPEFLQLFVNLPALPEEDRMLVRFYVSNRMPVDILINAPEFEEMVRQLREQGDGRSQREILERLLSLRKAGRLPRVASSSSATGDFPQ